LCFAFGILKNRAKVKKIQKKFLIEMEWREITMGWKIEEESPKEVISERISLIMLNSSAVLIGRVLKYLTIIQILLLKM